MAFERTRQHVRPATPLLQGAPRAVRAPGRYRDHASLRRSRPTNETRPNDPVPSARRRPVQRGQERRVQGAGWRRPEHTRWPRRRPLRHGEVPGPAVRLVQRSVRPRAPQGRQMVLLETVDVPEATKTPATDFIGVDLGVENIATDSDGNGKSSKDIEAERIEYPGGERRWARRPRTPVGTSGAAAAGPQADRDRKPGIGGTLTIGSARTSFRARKAPIAGSPWKASKGYASGQRFTGSSGSVQRLGSCTARRLLMVYKAQLAGVAVEFLDPAYTSQTCHACGHCERGNRKSQAEFVSKACGRTEHADVNAARNIRHMPSVKGPSRRKGAITGRLPYAEYRAKRGFSRGVLGEVIPAGRAGRYTILVIVPDAGRPSRLALVPRPCRQSESNSATKSSTSTEPRRISPNWWSRPSRVK